MAQKTPLTALTIDYADRWNGTWFAELSVFSYKLIEDYYLRFLITYFLRIKKQWLSLLSLNHSGGFLFFQIMTCYAHATVKSKPMLFPTQQGKVYLKDWQQQLENKVNKLTICQNLNSDIWQKRLPVKKQNMWNYLHNTLLVQNTYNLAGTSFLPLRQHATLSTWFHNKQVKSTLTLLSEPIIHVLLTAQHNNNSLVCSIQQKFINEINSYKVMKAKMKYLQNVDWLVFLPMVYNSKKKYYSLYPVNNVFIQKRLFSQESRVFVKLNNNYSSQIYSAQVNVQLKEFEVSRQQQLSLKKASVSSYKKKELTAHYFSKKTALYQTIYQSKSYLMRRIFAFKWYSSIKEGFHVFFKRFRFQFALKKTLIMLNTPLIFLAQALKRVTGLRQFFSYLPMNWSYYDYKPVKRYTIFERYGSKKYFVPTFVASHLTMSRGSPTVLVDLLVHKLRHEYQHTQFLSCVEKICRHLMAPPKSNTAYENVICKGLEILFTGKVNGSDRSKQWRFKLGPVHSSTFYTNTREEHANIITKFGAFSLRIRMKLGSVGVRYFHNHLWDITKSFMNCGDISMWFIIIKVNVILILLATNTSAFFEFIYIKWSSISFVSRASCNNDPVPSSAQRLGPVPDELLSDHSGLQQSCTTVSSEKEAMRQELLAAKALAVAAQEETAAAKALAVAAQEETAALKAAAAASFPTPKLNFSPFLYDEPFNYMSPLDWLGWANNKVFSIVVQSTGQHRLDSTASLLLKKHIQDQLEHAIAISQRSGIPINQAAWDGIVKNAIDYSLTYIASAECQKQVAAAVKPTLGTVGSSLVSWIRAGLWSNRNEASAAIGATFVALHVWQHYKPKVIQFLPEGVKKNRLLFFGAGAVLLFRSVAKEPPARGPGDGTAP